MTRRKGSGWAGSKAGKLSTLPAFAWRGARRYGWAKTKQANGQVCLRRSVCLPRYRAMQGLVGSKAGKLASLPALVEPMRDVRVGWESCLGIARCKTSWFGGSKAGKLASLPALGKRDARRGRVAMQANSRVCLLSHGAVQDAMGVWEASKQTGKSACVGMAQCQRLWLGGEGKQANRQGCRFARCETVLLGGQEGMQSCLPFARLLAAI